MTMSKKTTDRGSSKVGLTAKRRQAGTSLVEILVVIVIFLIGILAVVQVFPRGFRILFTTRNNSAASSIARDEMERIKSHPELLPDEILAVRYSSGFPVIDSNVDVLSYAPLGDAIDASGNMTNGGSPVGDWSLASGPNVARRIIGEGQRVPSPRQVGNQYGGLMLLDHGPIDPGPVANNPNVVVYANDLSRTVGVPREAVPIASPTGDVACQTVNGSGNAVAVPGQKVTTPVSTAPFEFFLADSQTQSASILLPTSQYDRAYRLRVSGYVQVASNYSRVDYVSLTIAVPALTDGTPLVRVKIEDILHASGALDSLASLGSVEVDTVRIAPQYRRLAPAQSFSGDPFEFRLLDPVLGVLLFSPAAREGVITRPGGVSEPLIGKVDYDVLDWRILREDFRLGGDGTAQLALQSLKVGTQNGPDGLPNKWIPGLETATSPTDNVVVVDVTTGGIVQETAGAVTVDKSRGLVTVGNADIAVPDPSGTPVLLTSVSMANRPVRILYRARNEWSVQILKSASQYSILKDDSPKQGQCLIGGGPAGGSPTRIYFPKSDANRKVTIDTVSYVAGGVVHTLEGQDFLIKYRGTDAIGLPSIDLIDVDTAAAGFASNFGEPVRGVKGASVAVRVLWNPDSFAFTTDPIANMSKVDLWARGWRKSMTETYLRAEETR